MSLLLLISIIIISRLLSKKLPKIASFFYDRHGYKMEHEKFIRDSLIDIRDSSRKMCQSKQDPILDSYVRITKTQLNIQNARKEIEQNYIIKKAIHDELNI